MSKLEKLIQDLRKDAALQADLRDPRIFSILAHEEHSVPPQFIPTFEKLLQLRLACVDEEEEFDLNLIVHPTQGLENATILDFSPQLRQRRQHRQHDQQPQEKEEEVIVDHRTIWSWLLPTLITCIFIFWNVHGPKDSGISTSSSSLSSPTTLPLSLPPASHVFQDTNVHLCEFPLKLRNHNDDITELTLGDLHGNGMKLLYFLVREGVFTISKETFTRACKVYQSTPTAVQEFDRLIQNGTSAGIAPKLIRLLGDEFADRGQNDAFTLSILQRLFSLFPRLHVEILLSNHGFEFYTYVQTDKMKAINMKMLSPLPEHTLFFHSLKQFHTSVKDKSSYGVFVQEFLLPIVKLVSYSVDKNGDVLVFTHAPIGMETLEQFARDFDLPDYCHREMDLALLPCLDAIQVKFDLEIRSQLVRSMKRSSSLMEFIWRRSSHGRVRRPQSIVVQNKTRLVRWVHGHDGLMVKPMPYGYCMDDDFGKVANDPSREAYHVLISQC